MALFGTDPCLFRDLADFPLTFACDDGKHLPLCFSDTVFINKAREGDLLNLNCSKCWPSIGLSIFKYGSLVAILQ